MNPLYERYRKDDTFRAALQAAARRERNEALARFFAATAAYFSSNRSHRAAGTRLARQG